MVGYGGGWRKAKRRTFAKTRCATPWPALTRSGASYSPPSRNGWRRMLEEGRYASIRELAIAEKVDQAYVGRVLNMTLMPPKEVEALVG
jgi:hypothetical protein